MIPGAIVRGIVGRFVSTVVFVQQQITSMTVVPQNEGFLRNFMPAPWTIRRLANHILGQFGITTGQSSQQLIERNFEGIRTIFAASYKRLSIT
jgi:hypothetical protein